jgi:hypothetical protein
MIFVVAAVPGVLLVCVPGFAAGGYFPGTAALLAAVLLACLAAWFAFAPQPAATLSGGLGLAAGALTIYCALALLSTLWSDAPLRGVLEFDRGLLYLAALLVGGFVAPSPARMRWVLRAIALGGVAICVAALASRTFPDIFTTAPGVDNSRLSFPLTYWNNLGYLAAITLICCTAIAADRDSGLAARALGAAATPLLAATLVLTLGRGPIATAIGGLVVLVVAGFGAGTVSALLAAGPACMVVVAKALGADLLTSDLSTTAAAIEQGHDLALVVAIATVVAGAGIVLLRPLEARLPPQVERRVVWSGVAAFACLAIVAGLLAGGPRLVDDAVDEFVSERGVGVAAGADQSERLTAFASNGRVDGWSVALDEFEQHPLVGAGAGTYEIAWAEQRPGKTVVHDAHSLYLETAGEMGVIGLALLLVALGMIGFAFVRGLAGPTRPVYAGLLAAFAAWAVGAGLDWLWEMPAVTAWLFFAGGAALAGPSRAGARSWPLIARLLGVAGALLLCVLPIRVALSQARLDDGLDAVARNDCPGAIDESLASLDAFGDRPEPYALIGYCNVRIGEPDRGAAMMREAVARDPDHWAYHYGLALTLAAAGLDPRREAERAQALNPLEGIVETAVLAFAAGDPDQWRRRAAELRLPLIWGKPVGIPEEADGGH